MNDRLNKINFLAVRKKRRDAVTDMPSVKPDGELNDLVELGFHVLKNDHIGTDKLEEALDPGLSFKSPSSRVAGSADLLNSGFCSIAATRLFHVTTI